METGLFAKHLNHFLLILYMNYVLHKLVNFVIVIGSEGNEFVPEYVHLGKLELEDELYAF
jgi:hypothetical protein